jgi:2-methylisocitrate lyase-like PEP mutase family enzyme
VAAAWGGQDNNTGREAAFAVLRRITNGVGVPVTADVEAGYGLPLIPVHIPGQTARALRAGANLAPDRAVGKRTWEEFLADRI